MITALLFTAIGLLGILKSADYFIDQSICLAKKLKVSSFLIGFTVVSFGTSLPELVISWYSAYINHTSLAVANVLGSNIANICLILSLLIIYKPYKLTKADVFANVPISLAGVLIFMVVTYFTDKNITTFSGMILLIAFFVLLFFSNTKNHTVTTKKEIPCNLGILFASLIGLIFFGKISVDGLLQLSGIFGIKESLLGYFIVAISTSLPELSASIMAIKKRNAELGIGNILGSNMLNLLFILGTSALITPIDLHSFMPELWLLALITGALALFALVGKKYYFTRFEGLALLCFYLVFIFLQFYK